MTKPAPTQSPAPAGDLDHRLESMGRVPADRPPHGPDQPSEGDDDPDERGERADRPENPPERGRTRYSWRDFELPDDEDTPPEQHASQPDQDQDPTRTEHPETEETGDGEAAEQATGWDHPDIADHPDRPDPEDIHLPGERRVHVLDRHVAGTGIPGRTEFPPDWGSEAICDTILDVARRPDETPRRQNNGRWATRGQRDGVTIIAIVEPDGQVVTGYPKAGGPGVAKNQ